MGDRIIEEVDEKLQGDHLQQRNNHINSIYAEISNVNREVSKFMSKMKHNEKESQNSMKSNFLNKKEQLPKGKTESIARYNYYGKKYRFEAKQEELNVPQPDFERQCMSEVPKEKDRCQEKQMSQCSPIKNRSKYKQFQSNEPQMGTNMFFDDGQVKFPSQNYYIYFDEPKLPKRNKKQKSPQKQKPQQFKPAWLMEKKINNLQKQVKTLKEREKRNRQAVTMSNFHNTKQTLDQPINLKSNLQKMIDTLWM